MYFVFLLMWIIFNGKVTLEIAVFGLVVAGVMYAFICKFMDYGPQKDKRLFRCSLLIVQYVLVLIVEILKANVQTTQAILSLNRSPRPVLVHFRTGLKTKTAMVVLANSITLTPGTITVSLDNGEYVVHCLDKSMAEGIESSVFVRLLEKMEGV